LVMPVYNEQDIIGEVIREWTNRLNQLKIDYQIHAYNDGSKDKTSLILRQLAQRNSRLIVHDQANSGHGPTLIRAYRDNLDAEWIFQVDSDNEMATDKFVELWEKKNGYQFLIGRRKDRSQPFVRKIISAVSYWVVKIFFGARVSDVNCPYRLMKTTSFKDIFFALPDDMFCPNVVISGWAARKRFAVYETDIPTQPRMTGEVSIKRLKLLRAAVRSFSQTIHFAFSHNHI